MRKLHGWHIGHRSLHRLQLLLCRAEEEGHTASSIAAVECSLLKMRQERMLALRCTTLYLLATIHEPCEEGIMQLGLAKLVESEQDSALP